MSRMRYVCLGASARATTPGPHAGDSVTCTYLHGSWEGWPHCPWHLPKVHPMDLPQAFPSLPHSHMFMYYSPPNREEPELRLENFAQVTSHHFTVYLINGVYLGRQDRGSMVIMDLANHCCYGNTNRHQLLDAGMYVHTCRYVCSHTIVSRQYCGTAQGI